MKVELKLDEFVGKFFFKPESVALVTTISISGVPNVAPKTQVMPIGRKNYWAFACCGSHHTYQNVVQQGEFVINIPGPELIDHISRSSADFPLGTDEIKAAGLTALSSKIVVPPSIAECRVHIECRRYQVLDGFGNDSLIIGQVIACFGDSGFVSTDPAILREYPLLAYIHPNHYATIDRVERFSFPRNYKP